MDWKKKWADSQAILWVLGFYGLLALMGHGCPIRWITGIPCPGCGLSRAYLALFKLDFEAAYFYHPMYWAVLLLGALCWRYSRKSSRLILLAIILLGAAFIGLYLWRLALKDPVLEIDLPSGLIYRIIIFFSRSIRFS